MRGAARWLGFSGAARWLGFAGAALSWALLAGCSRGGGAASQKTITVFAAASLDASFRTIGSAYETAYPGEKVVFQFAGTPTLVTQLEHGAVADLFASADEANMKKAADLGLLARPAEDFAMNRLVIAVVKGNPKKIAGLADLARREILVALCAPSVPAGRYAKQILERAKVAVEPRTFEDSVRGVVGKVGLGEVDAGIVYQTDVRAAADRVDGIAIPSDANVLARYPAAVLKGSPRPEAAQRFLDLLRSQDGRRILESHGFLLP
jgi:molybdate transport system substrate-binding protein